MMMYVRESVSVLLNRLLSLLLNKYFFVIWSYMSKIGVEKRASTSIYIYMKDKDEINNDVSIAIK